MTLNRIKNFCPAPFRQICINSLGEVSACCMINTEGFGKIDEKLGNSLNDIYNGEKWQKFYHEHRNEIMPELCEMSCFWKSGERTEYHHQWDVANNAEWELKKKEIKKADIAFSNICNLSCTMCGSIWSSEWLKYESHFNLLPNEYKQGSSPPNMRPWNFSRSQCTDLAKQLKNADNISVKGGEPFLNERFTFFLKELSKYACPEETHVNVITNGTIINKEALKLLNNFWSPAINISIESTNNELYRFIRGGTYIFDDIKQTIQYVKENCPNIAIRSNYITGSLNVTDLLEDMKNLRSAGIEGLNLMLIHYPIEQGIHVLNKKTINKYLKDFEQDQVGNEDFYSSMIKYNQVKQIPQEFLNLNNKVYKAEDLLQNFEKYYKLRKFQNIKVPNILDLVPDYLDRCNI